MNRAEIREFTVADLPRLHEIRVRAFTPIHDHFRKCVGDEIFDLHLYDWREKQGAYLDSICGSPSNKKVYVAIKDGLIAGFIGVGMDVARKSGEIDLNAVDPDFQGRGIGTAMYEFAKARLRDNGIKLVTVSTGGDEAHRPARAAYRKAGFNIAIPSAFCCQLL